MTVDRDGKVVSLGDDLKAAASDSLKKAASLMGVPIGGGHEDGAAVVSSPSPQAREQTPHRIQYGGATVRQLAAVNAASRQCGFNQRQLSEFVSKEVGKSDVSLLSKDEASRLIDRLNAIPRNGVSH